MQSFDESVERDINHLSKLTVISLADIPRDMPFLAFGSMDKQRDVEREYLQGTSGAVTSPPKTITHILIGVVAVLVVLVVLFIISQQRGSRAKASEPRD